MANKTVQTIYGMADDLLRQEGNSTGIPGLEESRTIEWVDGLHKQFFEEYLAAGRNYPEYMRKAYGDTMVAYTALAADVAAGASSLTVDSSSALDSSGAAVIYKNYQYDIFTFTGNSGGSVTGVSGIDFAHEDDDIVSTLYPLPSKFGRMRVEKDRGEGVRVNGLGYTQTPDMPGYRQFSLWQDSGSWYLWLPYIASGDILVTYDQKPTTLTTTTGATGTLDIPEQYPDYLYLVHGLKGIFKQVLDDTYVPLAERAEQDRILKTALNRNNTGRKVSASSAYFSRYGI